MKKQLSRILSFIGIALLGIVAFASVAQAKLPANIEEFNAAYAEQAKTPEGAVHLWLEANFLYSDPATRSLGKDILVLMTENLNADFEKKPSDATYVERMKDEAHIFRSYCQGAVPDNGYKADLDNCELTVTKSIENADGSWSVFIKSGGADNARQIKLVKKDDGHYHVSQYSTIYQKIRPAK